MMSRGYSITETKRFSYLGSFKKAPFSVSVIPKIPRAYKRRKSLPSSQPTTNPCKVSSQK